MDDLIERLLATRPDGFLPRSGTRCVADINPDGREAADRIEALTKRVAERDKMIVTQAEEAAKATKYWSGRVAELERALLFYADDGWDGKGDKRTPNVELLTDKGRRASYVLKSNEQ